MSDGAALELVQTLSGHTDRVWALAWSPAGKLTLHLRIQRMSMYNSIDSFGLEDRSMCQQITFQMHCSCRHDPFGFCMDLLPDALDRHPIAAAASSWQAVGRSYEALDLTLMR